MTLLCEGVDTGHIDAIGETLASVCKLRGIVEGAATGSLPNDGKVIDDKRAL